MMKGFRHLIVILVMVGSVFEGILILIPSEVSAYTLHDPIYIDGDADFTAQAASEGWPGDGTEGNPYIIEGYEINASFNNGIQIRSTTVHFIIRDSLIRDGEERCSGIYFHHIKNGTINNCHLENNVEGGISIYWSCSNTIINNTMIGNGIVIWGSEIEHWNTHNIDDSNNVNGKPVHYWKNQVGGEIPSDAGQVIIANCTNIRIENQELTNASVGIQLGYSSNITIASNIASNMNSGISLQKSSENIIINNDAINNTYGIYLDWDSDLCNIEYNNATYNKYGLFIYSDENIIINNNISFNQIDGIQLSGGDNNTIAHNTFFNNDRAIELDFSDINKINDNILSLNGIGIIMYFSQMNTILRNKIEKGHAYGIELVESHKNSITNNTIVINFNGIVLLSLSNKNNISGNIISSNDGTGIYLSPSSDNCIYHNRITDNTNQTYDNGNNQWDNGAGEGNYWSDYNGKDDGSGGRIAGDGVGDTELPHHDVDHYPLIEPVDIANYTEKGPNDEGSIFSEPWFIGSIILLIICILLVLILMNHNRKRRKPFSYINNHGNPKEQQ